MAIETLDEPHLVEDDALEEVPLSTEAERYIADQAHRLSRIDTITHLFPDTYSEDMNVSYVGEVPVEVMAYKAYEAGMLDAAGLKWPTDEMKAEREAFFKDIEQEYKQNKELLKQRLDELSDHDKKSAHGLQSWVLAELHEREQNRGKEFPHTSPDSYRETMTVLMDVIAELQEDGEDRDEDGRVLLRLADVWYNETKAELELALVHEYRDNYR